MQKEIVPFEIKIWLFSFYITAFFFVVLFNVDQRTQAYNRRCVVLNKHTLDNSEKAE